MDMKLIKTESEYEEALKYVDSLMDAEPGQHEFDQLEVWTLLVESYEQEHHAIDLPDAIEAIKFRMDQEGMIQRDLVPYIGSESKVSEVLNGKRQLSLSMIRKLHQNLGIPASVLLQGSTGTTHNIAV